MAKKKQKPLPMTSKNVPVTHVHSGAAATLARVGRFVHIEYPDSSLALKGPGALALYRLLQEAFLYAEQQASLEPRSEGAPEGWRNIPGEEAKVDEPGEDRPATYRLFAPIGRTYASEDEAIASAKKVLSRPEHADNKEGYMLVKDVLSIKRVQPEPIFVIEKK